MSEIEDALNEAGDAIAAACCTLDETDLRQFYKLLLDRVVQALSLLDQSDAVERMGDAPEDQP